MAASVGLAAQPRTRQQAKVAEFIRNSETLRGANVAVMAMTEDGDTLVAWNCDNMMVTASNMKLITTGTALHQLGGSWRFDTNLAVEGEVRDSVLKGNVYIIGRGDPCLGSQDSIVPPATETLNAWKKMLREAGIWRIEGNIIADGSYFDGGRENETWQIEDAVTDYGTGSTGLNWGENKMRNPDKKWTWISNKNQDLDCANELVRVMGSGAASIGQAPDSLNALGSTKSPELRRIARFTNWDSNNLFADVLFRTVGKEMTGSASYDSSAVAVNRVLASMGLNTKKCARIMDGSGLSRKNYVSPAFFCKFLAAMMDSPAWDDFIVSLPQPGLSGTVKDNMKTLESAKKNAIHMKSGSMDGVRNYSGYYIPEKGERIIFSVMVNNCVSRQADIKKATDRIISEIIQ